MTKEERVKKYNPYKTELHKGEKKLYKLLYDLSLVNFHDIIVGHAAAIEYIRYVEDSIELNEVPINYSEWISEQSHKYKK